MERRKTMTMNWKGIDDDDDDESFFESLDGASSSDDEEFQESRMSFSANSQRFRIMTRKMSTAPIPMAVAIPDFNYDMWMEAPGSITERRKRLLYGMGLNENKESLRLASIAIGRAMTRKFENNAPPLSPLPDKAEETKVPDPHDEAVVDAAASCDQNKRQAADTTASCYQKKTESAPPPDEPKTEQFPVPVPVPVPVPFVLVRSRSDGDVDSDAYSLPKMRKEELIGMVTKTMFDSLGY